MSLISISVIMIMLGLMGEDIFLNIAVSGPLIIMGIGAFFLLFTIESRHGFSQKIDIRIGNLKGLETSNKSNGKFIETGIFFLSVLMFLTSIYSLSVRNYTLFVISLFFGSSLLGIITGRYLGSTIGVSETDNTWDNLNKTAKHGEYLQMKSWLKGELKENLSLIQKQKIEQQKEIFLDEIKSKLSNFESSKDLISKLNDSLKEESGDIAEKLFINVLKKSYNNWLSDINDFTKDNKDSFVRKSLVALLLLPSIYELLSYLSKPNSGENSKLFDYLLACSGRFAIQLDSVDLIIGGSENASSDASILYNLTDKSLQKFINFISIKSIHSSDYDFAPWWLLNIRSMIMTMNETQLSENISSLSVYSSYVKDNIEDWCFTLSEVFGGKFPLDKSSDSSKVIMQIYNRNSGVFEYDLIRLTWQAYQSLR